jgi:Flp pilus assembly protein protease CpaA
MRIKHICASLLLLLIILFSVLFLFTGDVEKVIVPNHVELRDDLYIIVHEESQGPVKVIYYKKRK